MGQLNYLMRGDVALQGGARPCAMPHRHGEQRNLPGWISARQKAAMSAGTSRRFIEKSDPGPRSSDLPRQS